MKRNNRATQEVVTSCNSNHDFTMGGTMKVLTTMAALVAVIMAVFALPSIANAANKTASAPSAVNAGPREGSGGNNIVCNGVPSKAMLMYYVRGGTDSCGHHDIAAIWASQGITPQVASMMHAGTVCSSGGFSSTGRNHGPNSALDRPVRVGSTLFYVRPLAVWGSSCYSAWIGTTEDGRTVAVLMGCGNSEVTQAPPAPKPKPTSCPCVTPKPTPKTGKLVVAKGTTNGSTATFRFTAENLATHTKWYFRLRGGMSTAPHAYKLGTQVRIHENTAKGWIKQLDRVVTVGTMTRVYILNKPVKIPSAPGPKAVCTSTTGVTYTSVPPGMVNVNGICQAIVCTFQGVPQTTKPPGTVIVNGVCQEQVVNTNCPIAGQVHDSNGNCVAQGNQAAIECQQTALAYPGATVTFNNNTLTCTITQVNVNTNCSNVIIIVGGGSPQVHQEGNCNTPPPPTPPTHFLIVSELQTVQEVDTTLVVNGQKLESKRPICLFVKSTAGDVYTVTFDATYGTFEQRSFTMIANGLDQQVCATYVAPTEAVTEKVTATVLNTAVSTTPTVKSTSFAVVKPPPPPA